MLHLKLCAYFSKLTKYCSACWNNYMYYLLFVFAIGSKLRK